MQLARSPKTVALLLAALLATPLLAGCNANDSATGDASTSPAQEAAQETASDGSGDSSDGAEDETTSFSYNDYLDEDGMWQGVTALDYVTLPEDYTSIQIPADEVTPTEEDVREQIDALAESFSTTEEVTDRTVEDGDTVNIDYVGTIDGVEFEGGNTQGAGTDVTIGVTNYIDDFLDQLVGHTPGETFDVEVTFPEDYGVDELNGKDAVFSTTINYIEEQVTPEIDDTWVAENLEASFGWSTLSELEQGIKEDLSSSAVTAYVEDYVYDNSEVSEVPQVITDCQEDYLVSYYQSYADSYGVDLSEMLEAIAGVDSAEALIEQNRHMIDTTSRNYLVFQAIAEDAGITVSDEEVAAYLQEILGITDEEIASYQDTYGMPYLRLCTLIDKVTDLLTEGATVA